MSQSTVEQIDKIFHPKSVAVVGASSNQGNLGLRFIQGLLHLGFKEIYPVNPNENTILGLKGYPSLKDIPQPVDLVIIATPAQTVPHLVSECVEKGVLGIVIFSAGFGESSDRGKEIEKELVEAARRGGARIIGPNCVGIYVPSGKLAGIPGLLTEAGPVAMISQSGYLADSFSMMGLTRDIRFSKVISCGNQCDLNAADFLEYLGQDSQTKLIIVYLEGIKDGRRFFELARQISRNKPIIAWKGGVTELGARAAFSHTGSIAGSSDIWSAACKQARMITVDSAEQLLDLVLTFYHLPLPAGRRIAIVSGQGGFTVTASDACARFGLHLAKLSSQTESQIQGLIPRAGTSYRNPIDVSIKASIFPGLFIDVIKILLKTDEVDMIYLISGQPDPGLVDALLEFKATTGKALDKPLVLSLFPPDIKAEKYSALLEAGIVYYTDCTRGILALSRLASYSEFLSVAEAKPVPTTFQAAEFLSPFHIST